MKVLMSLCILLVAAAGHADSISVAIQSDFKRCEKFGVKVSVDEALDLISQNRRGFCSSMVPNSQRRSWSHKHAAIPPDTSVRTCPSNPYAGCVVTGYRFRPFVYDNFTSEQKVLALPLNERAACIYEDGYGIHVLFSSPLTWPKAVEPTRMQKLVKWIGRFSSDEQDNFKEPKQVFESKKTAVLIRKGEIIRFVQTLILPEMKWDTTETHYDSAWNDSNPVFTCEDLSYLNANNSL